MSFKKVSTSKPKFALFSGDPVAAKIGRKEGLEGGEKFEVLEQIYDEKTGLTRYDRVGTITVDDKKIWDNRFSKRIKITGSQSIEAELNIYNTLNANTITAQTNRVGSAAFLQPTDILAARVMRLGVKYRF